MKTNEAIETFVLFIFLTALTLITISGIRTFDQIDIENQIVAPILKQGGAK